MDTSILSQLTGKAARLVEPRWLQTGRVLAVRHWEPAGFTEIDLHLPLAPMQDWHRVPYLKCRVAPMTYRDYTPSGWDAQTRTCTLYVDTAHPGPGSRWAVGLQAGDPVSYLKIGSTHHGPAATSASIIGLGDASSLGHLLALQQMSRPSGCFSGAILMAREAHRRAFGDYFGSTLQPLAYQGADGHHRLYEWVLAQQPALEKPVFCLAGNQSMVVQLRRLLNSQGYSATQVKAQGFWS
jgi:NADPH-dependent ferric siderophore reductase